MQQVKRLTGLALILISTCQVGYSQESTDAKFLFKMWFYIEHVNQHL
jgi:hypothetical protein